MSIAQGSSIIASDMNTIVTNTNNTSKRYGFTTTSASVTAQSTKTTGTHFQGLINQLNNCINNSMDRRYYYYTGSTISTTLTNPISASQVSTFSADVTKVYNDWCSCYSDCCDANCCDSDCACDGDCSSNYDCACGWDCCDTHCPCNSNCACESDITCPCENDKESVYKNDNAFPGDFCTCDYYSSDCCDSQYDKSCMNRCYDYPCPPDWVSCNCHGDCVCDSDCCDSDCCDEDCCDSDCCDSNCCEANENRKSDCSCYYDCTCNGDCECDSDCCDSDCSAA